jgi:class 3 adenylate cyclase/pimeloyl-ACP methyl ester carboxylesterase
VAARARTRETAFVTVPEPRYAKSGDLHIAYRVEGDGPLDIVFVPPHVWGIDLPEAVRPEFRGFIAQLGSLGRVIQFDKRGTGSSDSVVGAPTLEERMDDVRAVMDAADSRCAALVGVADGSAMSLLFAATYPERTFALALLRAKPRYTWAPDYPWAPTPEEYQRQIPDALEARLEGRVAEWVRARAAREGFEIDVDLEDRLRQVRLAMSPGSMIAFRRMLVDIDVRGVLGAIRVPTLLIYRPDAPDAEETGDRYLMSYMAERIPHAEVVEAPEVESRYWFKSLLVPLAEFLPRAWSEHQQRHGQPKRVLATVLFTDLVASSAHAVELGPRWQDVLREHNAAVRRQLRQFDGSEIDTAGDGFFASGFDGPARAIRCGCAIRDAVTSLGLKIRVGIHTGECDIVDEKLSGLAVNIGSRVAAQANEGEVLVSGTVKDLVAGSGIQFEPRGVHELKGLGDWPLFAVRAP